VRRGLVILCGIVGALALGAAAPESAEAGLAHTLTINLAGTGSGTVTSAPAGISCPGDCSQGYVDIPRLNITPPVVTLTAKSSGLLSTFAGWTNCPAPSGTTCTVNMDSASVEAANGITITATFNFFPIGPIVFTSDLAVTKAGTGTGIVTSVPAGFDCGADCTNTYPDGLVVSLTATPDLGSVVSSWGDVCAGTSPTLPCAVTIGPEDKTASAAFTSVPTYELLVAKAGDGGGTVISSPAGIGCGADCSEVYTSGTVVTLTAAANVNSSFGGFGGPCTVTTASTCDVIVDAAKQVTATFSAGDSGEGGACTIRGTAARNVLNGTPGRDVICGLGGADLINGRGGADVIRGARGADVLRGGPGPDRLLGGRGPDVLRCGRAVDVANGGPGPDTCTAETKRSC
jgi:RTX calcium-binding nonapeptide repeat (4 copies)/Divergent InlB B-repeat domain